VLDDLFGPRPGLRDLITPDTVLCRCEGVTAGEIEAASFAELKLRTRAGQGPCQGRVCAHLIGLDEPSARPPLEPVPVRALL
jgi:hypothetical protein